MPTVFVKENMRSLVFFSSLFYNDYPHIEEHKFPIFLFKHIIAIGTFSEYLQQYCLCDFRTLCNRKLATSYANTIYEATKSITKLKLSFLCKKSTLNSK